MKPSFAPRPFGTAHLPGGSLRDLHASLRALRMRLSYGLLTYGFRARVRA